MAGTATFWEDSSMKDDLFLKSKTLSRCCRKTSIIVRSRDGGFVTQNCIECEKPYSISISELPDLKCDYCGTNLSISFEDGKNYFYRCNKCNQFWKLADRVPHWSEHFKEHGFGINFEY